MPRKVRASSGKPTRPQIAPVVKRKGYTLNEAAHMLSQGYTPEHVQQRTGINKKTVQNHLAKNGVPRWMRSANSTQSKR